MTQIPHWLRQRAQLTPHRLALISGGQNVTFLALHLRAKRTAGRLAASGIKPGDRVALLLRNGPSYVELVHAVSYLGAVLLPLNTRLTAPEVIPQVEDAGATALIHDDENRAVGAQVASGVPGLHHLTTSAVEGLLCPAIDDLAPIDVPLRARVDLDAPYAIMFTSGTSGRSKGVLLTYGNFWWSAIGSALNLGHHPDDRWLACLPLFHVGGLAILLRSAIYGIAAEVHETFDAAAVNGAIDTKGVTIISVVSTMLQRMLDQRGDLPYPSSLRCILLGGGPAPRPLLERCATLGAPVVQTYGLTETASQVCTLPPEDTLRKLGSAGKPLPGAELRIQADGCIMAPFEAGEIVVRGPMVTPGYIERRAGPSPFADGWMHTGDMGYLDEDGYLFVLDRRDDLIISGGENIYPAQVEAVLQAHPAVADVGVIGIPDPEWGQAVLAAVRLKPGESLSTGDLIAFCCARLAGFKMPRRILFVDSLPRNAAGKLVRARIPDLLPDGTMV